MAHRSPMPPDGPCRWSCRLHGRRSPSGPDSALMVGWNIMSRTRASSPPALPTSGSAAYRDGVVAGRTEVSPGSAGGGHDRRRTLRRRVRVPRPALSTQGAYFALATFAFAEMFRLLATSRRLRQPRRGYHVPLQVEVVVVVQFAPDSPNYFWIGLGFLRWRSSSVSCSSLRTGQFALAVRTTKMLPPLLGIHVIRYRLTTMALSAAITAVAERLRPGTTCSSTLTSPSDQRSHPGDPPRRHRSRNHLGPGHPEPSSSGP